MCDAEKYHLQVASLAPSHILPTAGPDICAYCGQYLFLCANQHNDCLDVAHVTATADVVAAPVQVRPRVVVAAAVHPPAPLRDGSCCVSVSTCGGTSNGTGSSTYSSPKLDATDLQPHAQQGAEEKQQQEEHRETSTPPAAPHNDANVYDPTRDMGHVDRHSTTIMHRLHPSPHHGNGSGSEEDGGEEDDDGGGPHRDEHKDNITTSTSVLSAMRRWNAQDNGGRNYNTASSTEPTNTTTSALYTTRHRHPTSTVTQEVHVDPTGTKMRNYAEEVEEDNGNDEDSSDCDEEDDTRPHGRERVAASNRRAMSRHTGSGAGHMRRSQVATSATAHIRHTVRASAGDTHNSSSDGDDVLREEDGDEQQEGEGNVGGADAQEVTTTDTTTTPTTNTSVAPTQPAIQMQEVNPHDQNEEAEDDEEEEEVSRKNATREPPQLAPPHPHAAPQTLACSPQKPNTQLQDKPSVTDDTSAGSEAQDMADANVIGEDNIPLSDARFACHAITRFVNTLCALNASEPVPSSDFHSYCVPPMTVELYVDRILRYCECSAEALLCGFILLLKYSFYSGHPVNIYNAHRLLITSTVLGIKMRDDKYYSNMYYARIGGIVGKEMNKLEVLFLSKLNWQLEVTPYEYAEMLTLMHAMMQKPSVETLRAFATSTTQRAQDSHGTSTSPLTHSNANSSAVHELSEEQLRADYEEAYQKDFWQRRIAPWLTRLQQASFARDAEHARLKQEDWQRQAARWRRYLAEEYAEAMQKSLSPSQASRWTSPQSIHSNSTYGSTHNNNNNNSHGNNTATNTTATHQHTNFLYQTEGGAQAGVGTNTNTTTTTHTGVRYTNFDYQYPATYQGVPISGTAATRVGYTTNGQGRATPQSQVMAGVASCHTNNRFGFANFFGQYSSATYQPSPSKAATSNTSSAVQTSSSSTATHQGFGILHRTSESTAWSPTATAAAAGGAKNNTGATTASNTGETASRTGSSVTVPGSGINIHAQPYYYTKHRAGRRSTTTTPSTTTTNATSALQDDKATSSHESNEQIVTKPPMATNESSSHVGVALGQASPPAVSAGNPALRCSNWSSPTSRQPPATAEGTFASTITTTTGVPSSHPEAPSQSMYDPARIPTTATLATTVSSGGSLRSPSSTSRIGLDMGQTVSWQQQQQQNGTEGTTTVNDVRTTFPSIPPTYSVEAKATMVVAGTSATVPQEKPTRMAVVAAGPNAKPLARTSNAGKKRPKPASYNDYYQ